MDGNLVIFLVIGGFYIASAVVQYLAKQATEDRQRRPQGSRNTNASDNFIEDMQRRAQEQRRNQGQSQDGPVVLRPVQRREAAARPLKARIVARPQGGNQAPTPRRLIPEPARSRHIHSQLEGERDLSDVDERHLSHLANNLQSQGDDPETEAHVAPTGGRSLGNQVAINYDVDESIDINAIGIELSPIQRAFVFAEVFAKRPAFEEHDDTSIRSF